MFAKKKKLLLLALSFFMALLLGSLSSGLEILDTRLYYSALEAQKYLNSLPPELAERYFYVALLDLLLFIPCYGLLLRELSQSIRLKWIARAAVSFDIAETLFILVSLKTLPLQLVSLAEFLSFCTVAKWSFLILWLVLLVGETLLALINIRGRQG